DQAWRDRWDWAIIVGSFLPALLWGVAFANIIRGVPINESHEYVGGFFNLLNPYALLGGLLTTTVFLVHGAIFVGLKTEGEIRERAHAFAQRLGGFAAVLAVAFIGWTAVRDGDLAVWIIGGLAAVAFLGGLAASHAGRDGWAFVGTALAIAGVVIMLFVALFPDVMPSSIDAAFSLTTENASSTPYTL